MNETGNRYGNLVVREAAGHDKVHAKALAWLCACDCGGEKVVAGYLLRRGSVKSCGCISTRNRKHGQSGSPSKRATPTYESWHNMKNRCYYEKADNYPNYGGRGITVCERWKDSFDNFLADMGVRPNEHTLDRVDPDGNYEPSNCRWATWKEQANNKRHHARLVERQDTYSALDYRTESAMGRFLDTGDYHHAQLMAETGPPAGSIDCIDPMEFWIIAEELNESSGVD